MELPAETCDALYIGLGKLRWPAYIGMLIWACVRFPLTVKKKIFLWVLFAASFLWGTEFCYLLGDLTKGVVPGNLGVAFMLFLMMVAAGSLVLKIPVRLSMDALIPAYVLGRGLIILGCLFAGCCHGFPASFGVYSRVAETITFPTVIIDSVVSCGIVIYLLVLARKKRWCGDGSVAAQGLLLFGALRILIDILRDNQKLVFLFTFEGLCGFIYMIVGALILLLNKQTSKEIHSNQI